MTSRLRLAFVAFLLFVPPVLRAQREQLPVDDLVVVEKKWPDAKKTSTGLRYVILKEGTGEAPKPGDVISVLYRGMFINGQVFDEEENPATPLTFRLGRGLVIAGWDQGLKLVRRGGTILLIVPPSLAYGTRGDPPKIAPQTTLIFEVQLLANNPDEAAPPPMLQK